MSALGRRTLGSALAAVAVIGLLATGAGLVRLMPWLLAREVAWPVAIPFGRVLAAVAVEAAVLVGVPVGATLAAAAFVDAGEARAMAAVGERPLVTALGALPVVAALSLLALLSGPLRPPTAAVAFAAELVEQARRGCDGAEAPRSSAAPLVGVTWLCFPGKPARAAGLLPGGGGWYSSEDLRLDASPRGPGGPGERGSRTVAVELRGLQLGLPAVEGRGAVRARVGQARLAGLGGLGVDRAGSAWRAPLVALSAVLAAWVGSLLALRLSLTRRWAALGLGAAGPVAVLAALGAAERGSFPLALVPALALLPALAALAGLAVARRVARAVSR